MDWTKIRDKSFLFMFIIYTNFILSLIIGLLFRDFLFLHLHYLIYLIPLIYVILHNIDLKNKLLLDEYLFLTLSSLFFGLVSRCLQHFSRGLALQS